VSASAFVLVDAILPIGNHTISEYLRLTITSISTRFRTLADSLAMA
jgi:hypothetical protein